MKVSYLCVCQLGVVTQSHFFMSGRVGMVLVSLKPPQ